jgi:hypothetical protein
LFCGLYIDDGIFDNFDSTLYYGGMTSKQFEFLSGQQFELKTVRLRLQQKMLVRRWVISK